MASSSRGRSKRTNKSHLVLFDQRFFLFHIPISSYIRLYARVSYISMLANKILPRFLRQDRLLFAFCLNNRFGFGLWCFGALWLPCAWPCACACALRLAACCSEPAPVAFFGVYITYMPAICAAFCCCCWLRLSLSSIFLSSSSPPSPSLRDSASPIALQIAALSPSTSTLPPVRGQN